MEGAEDGKVADLNLENEDVDFSKLKKKKKKAKPVFTEPEQPAAPEPQVADEATPASQEEVAPATSAADGEDLDAMFGDLTKKKKKSKKVEFDENSTGAVAEPAEGEFDGMQKKKKKGGKRSMAEFEKALQGDDDEEEISAGGITFGDGDQENEADTDDRDPWLGSNRDYTYTELLGRVFQNLRQFNPDLVGEKKKYTMTPPSIHREPKKTIFANLVDICRKMHREPEHLIQFLFAELGTTGSVDGERRLVIKGRFTQKQIEAIIRRYIMDYVQCKTCKSPDTILVKENRLVFQQCESCNSTRSVSAIKSGFKAQTEKRAAQRRAAG